MSEVIAPIGGAPDQDKESKAPSLHELPEVLDLSDVAALLRVHQKTVRLMAIAGDIPAFRAGRLWRFKKSKIERWLDADAVA